MSSRSRPEFRPTSSSGLDRIPCGPGGVSSPRGKLLERAGARQGRCPVMGGKVVHFELPADNVERARNFYKKTFQWEIQPMPEMNYTMVQTTAVGSDQMPKEPGAINGGIAARGSPSPVKAPVITIAVEDIDQTLKQVAKNGGKAVQTKQSIGPMGFTAYFQDPEGNVVGLWQAASE
jgi:uncharacterized protein